MDPPYGGLCVCVYHINRSGPNLMINNPNRKNKYAVADPVRGLPDRREKGGKKIIQSSCGEKQNNKAKTDTKRDGNRHEGTWTLKPGGRSKRFTCYGARRAMWNVHTISTDPVSDLLRCIKYVLTILFIRPAWSAILLPVDMENNWQQNGSGKSAQTQFRR